MTCFQLNCIAKVVFVLTVLPVSGLLSGDLPGAGPGARVLGAEADAPAVDLRPKFKAGRVSRYEIWTRRDITSSMSVHGRTKEGTQSMLLDGQITWSVDEVHDDGSATCTMTVDWVTLTLTLPDGSEHVNDSRESSGDTENLHKLLRAMSGAPVRVEVAANGRVEEVSGADEIRRELDDPSIEPEDIDFMESASDLALLVAGPDAAETSQNWKDQYAWRREMGMLDHDLTYSLESVNEIAGIPVANITGTAELSLEVDRSKFPAEGPPVDVQLADGSMVTQIMVDLQRGEVVGRNTIESTTIRIDSQIGEVAISSTTEQRIQSQALRIAE